MGFQLQTQEEIFLWRMYKYWKNGISCRQYRKDYSKDVEAVTSIDNMMKEKENIEAQINTARSQR